MTHSKNKISVLLVHHTSRISGAEISLVLLLKALDRLGYATYLLLPHGDPNLRSMAEQSGAIVKELPILRFKRSYNPLVYLNYLASVIACGIKLFRFIDNYRIRLVHANTTNAHIYAALPALCHGIPCVWHVRDNLSKGIASRLLMRFSTKIICLSEYSARQLAFKTLPKVSIVPNAIELSDWARSGQQQTILEEFDLPADCLIVAQIGQLVPWKNHGQFVQVAERIVHEFKNIRFLIVGSDMFGDNKSYLDELHQSIAARGLTYFFIFKSFTFNVKDILSQVHVLFHPAVNEPFGRVLIEAMALGKPIVSVNSGGPSEIVINNQTGFLVKANDTEAMVQGLLELLRNEALREEMGRRAKSRAEEIYNFQTFTASIEGIYKQLLNDEYTC